MGPRVTVLNITNSVSASSPCTPSDVTTRAVIGVPAAFSVPRNWGKSSARGVRTGAFAMEAG